MILVVFDIDGTLVDTSKVDGECYLGAMVKAFGIPPIEPNWDIFPDVTDSGIFRDMFTAHFSRPPEARETQLFIDTFVELLESAFSQAPDRFKEIPGARALLDALSESDEYAAAMATGGWQASAAFKLNRAQIDMNRFPHATSNDAYTRAEIVEAAIQRARDWHDVTEFSKVVLVGDGPWDVRTAQEMGHPFIGVGDETFFRSKGVVHSVRDYLDKDNFLERLDRASAPGEPETSPR